MKNTKRRDNSREREIYTDNRRKKNHYSASSTYEIYARSIKYIVITHRKQPRFFSENVMNHRAKVVTLRFSI